MGEVHTVTSTRYYWQNRDRPVTGEQLVIQRVLAGTCFFELQGDRRLVKEGECFLFWWGDASSYGYPVDAVEPLKIDYITMSGNGLNEIRLELREVYGAAWSMDQGGATQRAYEDLLTRYLSNGFADPYHNAEMVQTLLFALLRQGRARRVEADGLAQANDWIRLHYIRPLVTKEVADQVGWSREHLTRCFQERFGETPAAMTRRLRLERARLMLLMGDQSVANVAAQCGFGSPDTFSRAYRKCYGVCPRKRIRRSKSRLEEYGP